MRRLLLAALLLAVALPLLSSVMLIDADEVAIIYRFGAVRRAASSGLSLRLPRPIESDERVRVTEVRRVDTGRQVLLTGDTNLVEIAAVAQYTVSDPVAFVVAVDAPEALIDATVRSAVVSAVSQMEVDALLTTDRALLQRQVLTASQATLDRIGLGVQLEAVELSALEPPDPVVAAFNDVSSARGDGETMVLAAQSYASRQLPDVRGQAARLKEEARADAADIRARARADTTRFAALLPTWRRTPEALRRSLVGEAAGRVRAEIIVAPAGAEVVVEPSIQED